MSNTIIAPDIPVPLNYVQIAVHLGVGSKPHTIDDVQRLSHDGYTHILNVGDVDDTRVLGQAAWIDCGIRGYLYNPTPDDGKAKPASWFADSLAFALPLMRPRSGCLLYVHCYDGIDRGPSTAYCILRAVGFFQGDAAYAIRLRRPVAIMRYNSDAEYALEKLGYV